MPNHFHLAAWPTGAEDLSAAMHWLLTTHACRYQKLYRSTGHVWQGRFKVFPIQEDDHLLTVLRYIERNPLRAGLVPQAQDWRWSSLRWLLDPPRLPFLRRKGPSFATSIEQVHGPPPSETRKPPAFSGNGAIAPSWLRLIFLANSVG
jgi:hypothetical protein